MPNVFSKLNFIVLGASALTSFYGTDLVDNGFPFSFGLLMKKQKQEEFQKVAQHARDWFFQENTYISQGKTLADFLDMKVSPDLWEAVRNAVVDEHAEDWLSQQDIWIKQGKTLADFLLKKKVSSDLWEAVRNAVVKKTIYDSFLKLKSRGNTKRVLNFLIAKKRIFKEECAKDIDPNGIGKYGLAHYVCGGFNCARDPAKFHACIKEEAPLEILLEFMALVVDNKELLFGKDVKKEDTMECFEYLWKSALLETVKDSDDGEKLLAAFEDDEKKMDYVRFQAFQLWEEVKGSDDGKKLDAGFPEDDNDEKKVEYLENWLKYFDGDAAKVLSKLRKVKPKDIHQRSQFEIMAKIVEREMIRSHKEDIKDNFKKKAETFLRIVTQWDNGERLKGFFEGFDENRNDSGDKKVAYLQSCLREFDGDYGRVFLKLVKVNSQEIKDFAW